MRRRSKDCLGSSRDYLGSSTPGCSKERWQCSSLGQDYCLNSRSRRSKDYLGSSKDCLGSSIPEYSRQHRRHNRTNQSRWHTEQPRRLPRRGETKRKPSRYQEEKYAWSLHVWLQVEKMVKESAGKASPLRLTEPDTMEDMRRPRRRRIEPRRGLEWLGNERIVPKGDQLLECRLKREIQDALGKREILVTAAPGNRLTGGRILWSRRRSAAFATAS